MPRVSFKVRLTLFIVGMEPVEAAPGYMASFMGPHVQPMASPALRPMSAGMVAHPIPVPAAYTMNMNMYPPGVRPQMSTAVNLDPHHSDLSRYSPRIPIDMSVRHPAVRPSATATVSSCLSSTSESTSSAPHTIHKPVATCSCAPSSSILQQGDDQVTSSTPSTSGPQESGSGEGQPVAGPSNPRKRLTNSPQNFGAAAMNIPAKLFKLERELIDGMWRPWNFA